MAALSAEEYDAQTRHANLCLYGFLFLQFAAQLSVLVESLIKYRMFLRMAVYLPSIGFLWFVGGEERPHPSRYWMAAVFGLLFMEYWHPTTSYTVAAVAVICQYIAIASPLFWVSRLTIGFDSVRRAMIMFWVFHVAASIYGTLQCYFPHIQPHLTPIYDPELMGALKIRLNSGEMIWRPTGFSDVPGSAATSGMYATIFGLAFFLLERSTLSRIAAAAGMAVGTFCIYLSQVRSVLIMTVLCMLVLIGLRSWRDGAYKGLQSIVVAVSVVLCSYYWAVDVAGTTVTSRLETLVEDDPTTVYEHNRGIFLKYTIYDLIPTYPFGAGIGRTGMMTTYFADNERADRAPLYSEIQITAWVFDGGVPLLVLYLAAVIHACWILFQIVKMSPSSEIRLWASTILAYDISCLACCLNYLFFQSEYGLAFWFFNAMVVRAAVEQGFAKPSSGRDRAARLTD